MKTYVITLAKKFQKPHPRTGESTEFKDKFLNGQKIHTIRLNYLLWENRIKEVQDGKACLSIRQWSGTPYNSPQEEIRQLTAEDSVGIQKLRFSEKDLNYGYVVGGAFLSNKIVAKNDGLSKKDWEEWFSHYDLSQTMAIIHFTNFRY